MTPPIRFYISAPLRAINTEHTHAKQQINSELTRKNSNYSVNIEHILERLKFIVVIFSSKKNYVFLLLFNCLQFILFITFSFLFYPHKRICNCCLSIYRIRQNWLGLVLFPSFSIYWKGTFFSSSFHLMFNLIQFYFIFVWRIWFVWSSK